MLSREETVERTWVFNENSDHRGVWHVVKGELDIRLVASSSETKVRDVIKWHPDKCYTYPRGTTWSEPMIECVCSLQSDQERIVVGQSTDIIEKPAHVVTGPTPSLCNQVTVRGRTWLINPRGIWSYGKPGETRVLKYRASDPHVFMGELPPGPSCSRCEIAAERLESGIE